MAAALEHRQPQEPSPAALAPAGHDDASATTASEQVAFDIGLGTSDFAGLLKSVVEAVVSEPVVALCIRPRGGHFTFLQVRSCCSCGR